MALRNIYVEGDPILRKVCRPVEKFDEKLATLLDDMHETLNKAQGVGLAAPQVDASKRMTAVLVPDEEGKPPFFKHVLVNPTILSESVQMAALSEGEGCLSVDREVPGYVPRHEKIKLRWYDLDGNEHVERLRDYTAIVVQHEIDHLNGIMFYDHINQEDPFFKPNDLVLL